MKQLATWRRALAAPLHRQAANNRQAAATWEAKERAWAIIVANAGYLTNPEDAADKWMAMLSHTLNGHLWQMTIATADLLDDVASTIEGRKP